MDIEKFKKVVNSIKGFRIYILITQVDPDALGSAFALEYILRLLGVQNIKISYGGSIGHPQNRGIMYRFDLKKRLETFEQTKDKLQEDDVLILVDSSTINDVRLGPLRGIQPKIVIDHHRGSDAIEDPDSFVWVEDAGAASTLIIELLKALEFTDFSEKDWIATLLALGIYTDTGSLISCASRDLSAYNWVTTKMDDSTFKQLVEYSISPKYLQSLQTALQSQKMHGSTLITSAGFLDAENGDDLSTIANMFIRVEGVTLVIVWGVIGGVVRLSARSTDLSTPLDGYLREHFGDRAGATLTPNGHSEGGAVVELGLGFWGQLCARLEILALVDKVLSNIILK